MAVTIGLSLFACQVGPLHAPRVWQSRYDLTAPAAVQTRIDFTVLNGTLYSLLWVLIMFGFMQIWFHSQVRSTRGPGTCTGTSTYPFCVHVCRS